MKEIDPRQRQKYIDSLHDQVNKKLDKLRVLGNSTVGNGNINVLVVEDNLMDVEMMRHAIIKYTKSCDISVVTDGDEAIKYLNKESPFEDMPIPDLIIVDMMLPKIQGDYVIDFINERDHLKWIPVIAISSNLAMKPEQKNVKFIEKPISVHSLSQAMASVGKFWYILDNLNSV